MRTRRFWGLFLALFSGMWALTLCDAQGAAEERVSVFDDGGRIAPSTYECPGHQVLTRNISLENARIKYAFKYTGCQDPSHQGEHPASEGNFGMPLPAACNWYHSGFFNLDINGKDVVRQDVQEMRILESGARGGFQIIWAHPEAIVGLRIFLLPGANHVLCLLQWQPRQGAILRNVTARFRCYPSFFTAFHRRRGERHVKTPRTDAQEPSTLQLVPGEDLWLLYYDAVFDIARGEGEGPCALAIEQAPLAGGNVAIGDYAVLTNLNLKPEVGSVRFALYDFAGFSNAQALAYMQEHGREDLAQLAALDFRPRAVQEFELAKFQKEAEQLLAEAAEDGKAFQPQIATLLAKAATLQERARSGDWQGEADLAELLRSSEELFWKLRIFSLLNRP